MLALYGETPALCPQVAAAQQLLLLDTVRLKSTNTLEILDTILLLLQLQLLLPSPRQLTTAAS